MKNVLIILTLLFSLNVKASEINSDSLEVDFYVGAWSKHIVQDSNYLNERHDLLAVGVGNVFVGRFLNSFSRETFAVAYKWSHDITEDIEAGAFLGAMRGYTTCYGEDGSGKNICPLAAPFVSYNKYFVKPTLLLLGDAIAITAKIEVKFGLR